MQDKSTTGTDDGKTATGTKLGSITNNTGAVRFSGTELLDYTKKAVNVIGIDFDGLDGMKKEAFVGQAIGALTGVPPTKSEELYGKTDPAVTTEFRKLLLNEVKNSPNWDQDEFIAGYVYNGPIGKSAAVTEELQHSNR